jgi:hypothetical protein
MATANPLAKKLADAPLSRVKVTRLQLTEYAARLNASAFSRNMGWRWFVAERDTIDEHGNSRVVAILSRTESR